MKNGRNWFSPLFLSATLVAMLTLFSISASPVGQLATHPSPNTWCCVEVDGQIILKPAGIC